MAVRPPNSPPAPAASPPEEASDNARQAAAALRRQAAALVLHRDLLTDHRGRALLALLDCLQAAPDGDRQSRAIAALDAYGRWFAAAATSGKSALDWLLDGLLALETPWSRALGRADLPPDAAPDPWADAVRHDLRALQALYAAEVAVAGEWTAEASVFEESVFEESASQKSASQKSASQKSASPASTAQTPAIAGANALANWTAAIAGQRPPTQPRPSPPTAPPPEHPQGRARDRLRSAFAAAADWGTVLPVLADYFRTFGSGPLAEGRAFRWHNGAIVPVPHPDPIRLADLAAYDLPRQRAIQNVEFLLAGAPALHVLLYGSRGSGKSSLVKALLSDYGDRGLRLVEVAPEDLRALPELVERLRDRPQKFVLFVDDLSFEDDDAAFKTLKVALEGSLTHRPSNVVVYATSNRRHLVREFFDERPRPRDASEIHAWDTVQEKLSFADRFGLVLTFEAADQNTYLKIVRHLAERAGLAVPREELERRALQWAVRHNGRSGRTARQFADVLRAEAATGSGPQPAESAPSPTPTAD